MSAHYFDLLPLRAQPQSGESLSGFITRLAERNRLQTYSSLATLMFSKKDFRAKSVISLDYSPKLDQLSVVSNISLDRLRPLTFYSLATNFGLPTQPQRISRFLSGTISDNLRFCPQCLGSDVPYWRLIWRFNHVSVCKEHRCFLLDRCQNCGQSIPLFSLPPRITQCSHCGIDLWKFASLPISELDAQKVFCEQNALEILLRPITNWDFYQNKNLTLFLGSKLREYCVINRVNLRDFSESIGIDRKYFTAIWNGSTNRKYLGLQVYLTCFQALNLTLSALLSQGTELYELDEREFLSRVSKTKRPKGDSLNSYYANRMKSAIDELRSSKSRVTAVAIARLMGVSTTLLYSYNSTRALLPSLNQEKNQRFKERSRLYLCQIQDAWHKLYSSENTPSRDDLIKQVGSDYFDHFQEVRDWLTKMYCEARVQRQMQFEMMIIAKLEDIKTMSVSIHSLSDLSQYLGSPVRIFKNNPPIWQRITEIINDFSLKSRDKIDENRLISEIYRIRLSLLDQGIRVTQLRIAVEMKMSVSGLRKYPRVRVIFDEIAQAYRKRGKSVNMVDTSRGTS